MSNFIDIKTQGIDKILSTLADQNSVNDIIYQGLEAMAGIYYNSVLSSLRSKMGAAADTAGINGKYSYTLASGISKFPDKENLQYGINALKDFRLIFFEGGTKPRYSKGKKIGNGYFWGNKKKYKREKGTGSYRGMIKANHFFTEGIANAQQQALQTLITTIEQAIRNKGINING